MYNNIDFNLINKSFFESARDYAVHSKNKKSLNEDLFKTDEELQKEGFFQLYPHLR